MLLPVTGLLGMQSSANIPNQSDDVVGDVLQVMQDCITFNQLVTKNNPQLQQVQQQSMWKRAINYIENIRSENKSNVERPDLAQLNQVAFAQNRSEELFSRLLDEVLVHYTILSETKGRLYGRVYNLASVDGENQPILGAHENDFRNILQNGAKQAGWGKSIIVNLPAVQQDGAAIVRSLNLHEIINALPAVGMSTAAKVGLAVGGAAAIGAAAYGAYNYAQQPGASPISAGVEFLEKNANNAEDQLQNLVETPQQIDVSSYESAAQEFSEHLQQLEKVAAANPNNQAAQEELAQAQGTLAKLQNGDFAALTTEDYGKIGLGAAGIGLGAKGVQSAVKTTRQARNILSESSVDLGRPKGFDALNRIGTLKGKGISTRAVEDATGVTNYKKLPFTENAAQWRNMPENTVTKTQPSMQNRVNQHIANREQALGENATESVFSKISSPFTEKSGSYPTNKGVLVGEGSPNLSKEAVLTERGALDNLRVNQENIAAATQTKLLPAGPSKNMTMAERAEQNAANKAQAIQEADQAALKRQTYNNNKNWKLAREEANSLPNKSFNEIEQNAPLSTNRSWDKAIQEANQAELERQTYNNNKNWKLAREEANVLPNKSFNEIEQNAPLSTNRSWDKAIQEARSEA
jgi:hypothetical protein